jgi:hypothetical protein
MRNFICNLYSSPDLRIIKSKRMRWVGHVTHMGNMRNEYKILVENPEERITLKT